MTRKFLFLLTVLLIWLLVGFTKNIFDKYSQKNQSMELKTEIEQLKENKKELEKILEYVKTSQFKEKKAKELLGKKYPNEVVIVLDGINTREMSQHRNEIFEILERSDPKQWLAWFIDENRLDLVNQLR